MNFTFPFGTSLRKVKQVDRSPKKIFILGVYASAVHAKWIDQNNKVKVRALAVFSEPYIFWRGDNAEKIIRKINIPKELGHLEPANKIYNGPSGIELDRSFLEPLGFDRTDAWLCDIIPYSRINNNQHIAIKNIYEPVRKEFNLPEVTIPKFYKRELDNEKRRKEILKELEQSQAETIILLGDLPIKWFLSFFIDKPYTKLSDFGKTKEKYGRKHELNINGKIYGVIPLVHPRQAGRLGKSDKKWSDLHTWWVNNKK